MLEDVPIGGTRWVHLARSPPKMFLFFVLYNSRSAKLLYIAHLTSFTAALKSRCIKQIKTVSVHHGLHGGGKVRTKILIREGKVGGTESGMGAFFGRETWVNPVHL